MVNVPGSLERRNVYAVESAPALAIENDPADPFLCCGLNTDPRAIHPNGSWFLALVDGNGACNAFEAVVKFTACSETRLYPGGVTGVVFDNKDDVLRVFESLSWISSSPCGIEQYVYQYPEPTLNPASPECP